MSEPARDASARRLPPSVLAITPGTLQRSASGSSEPVLAAMERAAAAAFEGGVRGLLLREPSLEDGPFLELALRLRERLNAVGGGWLGLHDRLHLVEAAGADGGHIGGRSLPALEARLVLGPLRTLGASSHEGDDSDAWGDADYLVHAPVFHPTSKPSYGRALLGWSAAEDFAKAAGPSVYALGGVTPERLQAASAQSDRGGRSALAGVALIGGLWGTTSGSPEDGAVPRREVPRELTDLASIARRAHQIMTAAEALFGGLLRGDEEAAP